jgi:hypothetical protein
MKSDSAIVYSLAERLMFLILVLTLNVWCLSVKQHVLYSVNELATE